MRIALPRATAPEPVAARDVLPETSPASPPGSASANRLVALDGLRFLAAGAVLLYHFTARDSVAWGRGTRPGDVWPEVFAVSRYGHLGVQLFFVISGFVILLSAWGRTPREFVVSRATRLLPAYWVAVLATGFLLAVVWQVEDVPVWRVVTNLTMVQTALGVEHVDGVYWTLWAEVLFYALVGVLMVVGLTRQRVILLVVLWPAVAALAHHNDQELVATVLGWSTAPFFCMGIVVFLIHRWGGSTLHLLLLAYVWALAVGVTAQLFPAGAPQVTGAMPSLGIVLGVVSLLPVLVWCAVRAGARGPWGRCAAALGSLTYPLYLLHEYWGWFVIDRAYPAVGREAALALATATCLAMAWAVHRLVERPLAPRLRRALEEGLADAAAERAPRPRR